MSLDETPKRWEWVYALSHTKHKAKVWSMLSSLACVDPLAWLSKFPAVEDVGQLGEADPRNEMPVKQWRPYNALVEAVNRYERIIHDHEEEQRFLSAVLKRKYRKQHL